MRRATVFALAATLAAGCGSMGVRIVVQPGPGGSVVTAEEEAMDTYPILVRVENGGDRPVRIDGLATRSGARPARRGGCEDAPPAAPSRGGEDAIVPPRASRELVLLQR